MFRVTDITTPVFDPNSPEAKDHRRRCERQIADDLVGQYIAWLEKDLGININQAALAQASGNGPPGTN